MNDQFSIKNLFLMPGCAFFFSLTALIVSLPLTGQIVPYPAYTTTVNSGSPGGYYFLAPFRFNSAGSTAMILDSTGETIYYKGFSFDITDFKLQSNNLCTYFLFNRYELLGGGMSTIDSVNAPGGFATDAHELKILPNGHYLLLATEKVYMNLTGYNYFHNDGAEGNPNAQVTCGIIQELDNNKNPVFQWHLKDHISFNSVDNFWLSDSTFVDWSHCNALELDLDGNLLLSSRHFNEITKINRTSGAIMWRFGGKYNQFQLIGDTVPFYGQHDIRRLPNGHITLFDDGRHNVSHPARAVEYELDEINMTAKLKWSYVYDNTMESLAMGNVQRLSSGNTVVNYGATNNKNICFTVVDTAGNSLFKLVFADTLCSYRTFNVASLPPDFVRPTISCFDSAGVSYLDAGAAFSSYKWNNGQTNRIIRVDSVGVYDVIVPWANNSFMRSQKIVVTDLKDVCQVSTTSLNERSFRNKVSLFPNPASQKLTIHQVGLTMQNTKISVKDIFGRFQNLPTGFDVDQVVLDVSTLSEGVYFLTLGNQTFKFIRD